VTLFDYHSHSRYCDGAGNLADYIESALSRGLAVFGMSGHAPCSITSGWHMKAADLASYLREARSIAGSCSGRIEVLVGLEADYVPGVIEPRAVREANRLDYVIGSVHYLERMSDGTPWTVDGPAEELRSGIRESFAGDARPAVQRYFALVAEMVARSPPDIVGHIDLIRKNNDGLFDTGAAWYRRAFEETLDAVAASQAVVEVNTGAVSRGYGGIYPADDVLSSMARRRIPVTLGSDAHRPEHVAAHFPAALDCLARAGYRECWRLERSGWKAVPLDGLDAGDGK
jgi:histidinol-phosphatase (PHP family)